MSRFDLRTFILILGAALLGAAWAIYNRGLVPALDPEPQLRAQVWVIFATPFAMFWGWFFSRPAERLWAVGICFCIYFFAPFVAARIGVPQTRHLALTAARFKGAEAVRIGIGHYLVKDSAALDEKLEEVLKQIDRCAPLANALTKQIIMRVGTEPLSATLDFAADCFAQARRSPEAAEGLRAFAEKRPPRWAG